MHPYMSTLFDVFLYVSEQAVYRDIQQIRINHSSHRREISSEFFVALSLEDYFFRELFADTMHSPRFPDPDLFCDMGDFQLWQQRGLVTLPTAVVDSSHTLVLPQRTRLQAIRQIETVTSESVRICVPRAARSTVPIASIFFSDPCHNPYALADFILPGVFARPLLERAATLVPANIAYNVPLWIRVRRELPQVEDQEEEEEAEAHNPQLHRVVGPAWSPHELHALVHSASTHFPRKRRAASVVGRRRQSTLQRPSKRRRLITDEEDDEDDEEEDDEEDDEDDEEEDDEEDDEDDEEEDDEEDEEEQDE
jgi:hypothetical protein